MTIGPLETFIRDEVFFISFKYFNLTKFSEVGLRSQHIVIKSDFLNNDFNFDILKKKTYNDNPGEGWVQFLNRDVYFKGGMENENFMGSAPDDFERRYRFTTLGYRVHRVNNYICHLEHSRGMNSYPQSMTQHPYWKHNWALWEQLKEYSKEQLIDYYSKQNYLKKYS